MREIKKIEFTKDHTLIAKSIAIILMFIHHLFAFSNRGGEYSTVLPILEIGGRNIEYHLAIYGKICVAMYLFLSGYGMAIIENRKKITFKDSIVRVKKIYLNYLIVFLLFIPLGFYINKFDFNGFEIIKNLTGLINSYNDAWWFFRLYIILILIFPLSKKIISDDMILSLIKVMFIYSLPILASKCLKIFPEFIFIEKLYMYSLIYILTFWQASFFMGYIFYKFKFYEILKYFIVKYKLDKKYIYIIAVLGIIYIRTELGRHGLLLDFLNAPILIFFISNIFYDMKYMNIFKILGNHSTNMWLTHSFFCFSYFQELIFYPKYSILILLNLIFVTLLTSKLIEKILRLITNFKLEKLNIFENKIRKKI